MTKAVKFKHHPHTIEVQILYPGHLVRFKHVPQLVIHSLENMLQHYGRTVWDPHKEITPTLYKSAYAQGPYMLRLRRYEAGLSQRQLADYLGIKQSNLSMMERGKRVIGLKIAKRLGKFFNRDYRNFL